jgi:hypothetical protein
VRELSVDDLLEVIEGLCGLTGARPQLIARLKHLHRLGFPSGHDVGRGYRTTYDAVRVVQISLAFVLLDVGLPPSEATGMVATSWPVIVTGIRFIRSGAECQLVVETRALADMGLGPGRASRRKQVALLVHEGAPLPSATERDASIRVDIVGFMRRLERLVVGRSDIDVSDWRSALEQGLV